MSVILRLNKSRQKQNGAIPIVADVSYKRLKKKIYLQVDVANEARWDQKKQNIRSPKGIEKIQFQHIENEKARLIEIFITAKMKGLSAYEFNLLLKQGASGGKKISDYFDALIKQADARGANSMMRLFSVAKNVWLDVIPDLHPSEIGKVHVAEFVAHKLKNNASTNSIHQYANLLLAVLKEAQSDGIAVDLGVFKNQLPKLVKQRRAAYTDAELVAMFTTHLDQPAKEAMEFLKCALYCCGCDISDLLRIPKEQYERGLVNYKRNKTGVPIKFTVNAWAKDFILNARHYNHVQKNRATDKVVRDVMRRLLKELKESADVVGVQNLLLKRARHTWATIAKKQGVSKDVIAEALGHKGSMMTDVYLGAFDLQHVDAANDVVIAYLEAILCK
jgi:integrase/recombinase XerD